MSGRPIVCPHCGYKHWLQFRSNGDYRLRDGTGCARCGKDVTKAAVSDIETVCVNGRYVNQKRKAEDAEVS